jgi:hypothetical protein
VFDYRYHALSLAAVLFALAVGVVIGVAIGDSNLVSSAKSGIVHDLRSDVSQSERQAGDLSTQLAAEEAFERDLYPIAVHGLLTRRSIGLVFLGASSDTMNGSVRDAATSPRCSPCVSPWILGDSRTSRPAPAMPSWPQRPSW